MYTFFVPVEIYCLWSILNTECPLSQALKTTYNSLAPVCAAGMDCGETLSSLCEPGPPRSALNDSLATLHRDWERLGQLFAEALARLTEALVQTQEFKSIAGQSRSAAMAVQEQAHL